MCAGTRHTRCALWAARSCRIGVVKVACTMRLGLVWLGELVVEADMWLVAK
jgi:hypothetical protein